MNQYLKVLLYGFIIWLVPTLLSIPLYPPPGQPLYDPDVFELIRTVHLVGIALALFLAARYFRDVKKNYTRQGAVLGISWLLIISVLDIVILNLSLKGIQPSDWGGLVWTSYLLIPAVTTIMGAILESRVKK